MQLQAVFQSEWLAAQNISMQKKPSIHKRQPAACLSSPPFPARLPPAHGMQWPRRARPRGAPCHLQDILHRTTQSQWQRQKQCQIHSLLTILRQHAPQRAPLRAVLMPGAHCPPRGRPGFTTCNLSATAHCTRTLQYLIGPPSSPIATLWGARMPDFTV